MWLVPNATGHPMVREKTVLARFRTQFSVHCSRFQTYAGARLRGEGGGPALFRDHKRKSVIARHSTFEAGGLTSTLGHVSMAEEQCAVVVSLLKVEGVVLKYTIRGEEGVLSYLSKHIVQWAGFIAWAM